MSCIVGNGLYIHIPKTGGTFLKFKVLPLMESINCGYNTEWNLAHINIQGFKELYGKVNLTPFCFIRHPASLFYSRWCHMRSINYDKDVDFIKKMCYGNSQKYYDLLERKIVDLMDYDSLERSVDNFLKYPDIIGEHYYHYTKDCHYIGKQENLIDDFFDIIGKINPGTDIEKLKSTVLKEEEKINISESKEVFTDEMRYEISENEKLTIVKYDY